jgi:hypothetical protein
MDTNREKFCNQLRKDSNYPYSRKVAKVFKIICLVICWWAVIAGFGNIIAWALGFYDHKDKYVGFYFVSVFFGGLVGLVFVNLIYEGMILLIDIADASMQSAYVNHASYLLAAKRSKSE